MKEESQDSAEIASGYMNQEVMRSRVLHIRYHILFLMKNIPPIFYIFFKYVLCSIYVGMGKTHRKGPT